MPLCQGLVRIHNMLCTMKNNESADGYGLPTKHFKTAGPVCQSALALCYNVTLAQGHMPADDSDSQIVIWPVAKDKRRQFCHIQLSFDSSDRCIFQDLGFGTYVTESHV